MYQPVPGFEDHLKKELGAGIEFLGPLFFVPLAEIPDASGSGSGGPGCSLPFWHQNAWLNPVKIEFDSIGQAA
ncbi:MAG: hypothetical protein LBE10_02210, partial [Treponema sp.]|nr:hypothetical protein [Treponema sp.]